MRRVAVNERGLRIGADHPRAKIPDSAIELILELRDAGLSYAAIALKFDDPEGDGFTVSKSMVFKVCAGLLRAQVAARIKSIP